MIKYRVTLGETPVIVEQEILRETPRHYIDTENRVWHKLLLRDYRWFNTYLEALRWVEQEYKIRKHHTQLEYESICHTLESVQEEILEITNQ